MSLKKSHDSWLQKKHWFQAFKYSCITNKFFDLWILPLLSYRMVEAKYCFSHCIFQSLPPCQPYKLHLLRRQHELRIISENQYATFFSFSLTQRYGKWVVKKKITSKTKHAWMISTLVKVNNFCSAFISDILVKLFWSCL